MKKAKPIIILVGTLILGFAIGFLVCGNMMHQRMEKHLRWGDEEGFKEVVYEILEPSADEKATLDPLLDKYAQLNKEQHGRWRSEHTELMITFQEELDPILTDAQRSKWEAWKTKRYGK